MRAKCMSQVAESAGFPVATVQQMVARGVLPRGDLPLGRLAYYSPELSEAIERWLKEQYVPHKRYAPGQVKINKEVIK